MPKHFLPENDTWEIIKHENSIKNLNRGIPFLDLFKSRPNYDFEKYDICIGCGLTPYYFNKWGFIFDDKRNIANSAAIKKCNSI